MAVVSTAPPEKPVQAPRLGSRRAVGVIAALIGLIALAMGSIAMGSNPIPLGVVWDVLWNPNDTIESIVVHEQRIPRTILVIAAGAALGVAGALMQSLTRNPLADPGVLGINAGAALAVVLVVALTGITSIWFYLWFAFAGAAAAAVAVYVIGAVGRDGVTPARLALAGMAITMAVTSLVQAVILADQRAFNEFRFWAAGSVEGRGYSVLLAVGGFIVVGLIMALTLGPVLNALALGEDAGKALGVRVNRTRILVMLAVTLLAGAATAACGPIAFIGLGVPYLARAIGGPDQRWVMPFSAITGPIVLLAADLVGRIIIAPQEVQVGVIAGILGGPVFVLIVRRHRLESW